jgi:hypothetical protein
MDVKTAFLHGNLEEEIYMAQPEGAKEPGKETHVAWLNKALYGLMQAAREWNKRLHTAMTQLGYNRIAVEHCVYVRTTQHGTSIVAVHVDDVAAAASSKEEMACLKRDLGKMFDLVDLGEVQWLLGCGDGGAARTPPRTAVSIKRVLHLTTTGTRQYYRRPVGTIWRLGTNSPPSPRILFLRL